MKITIRDVTEHDANSICDLMNPIIKKGLYSVIDELSTENSQREFIKYFPKSGTYLAAVSGDGQVVGTQDVEPILENNAFHGKGSITTFVTLDHHRKGIGKKMMIATFKKCKALGFKKLIAVIRSTNQQAISFYTSHGFKIIEGMNKQILVRRKPHNTITCEKKI